MINIKYLAKNILLQSSSRAAAEQRYRAEVTGGFVEQEDGDGLHTFSSNRGVVIFNSQIMVQYVL